MCVCAHTSLQHSSESTVIDLFTSLSSTSLRALRGRRRVVICACVIILHILATQPIGSALQMNVWAVCTVNKLTKCYSFSTSVKLSPRTRIFKSSQNKTSHTPKSNQEKRKQRPIPWAPSHLSLSASSPTTSHLLQATELARNSPYKLLGCLLGF